MPVKKRVLTPGKMRPQQDRIGRFRSGKLSAEQAYLIAAAQAEEDDLEIADFADIPQVNLMGPPAREGYETKWIRVQLGGVEDWRNELLRTREGWEPVISEKTGNKPLQVGDSIYMERPLQYRAVHERRLARANAAQLQSLLENEFTDRLPGVGGFGPLSVSRESVTEETVEVDF